MKPEMRHKLAQLPFEEKIRKVGELIRLSRKIKTQRVREGAYASPARSYPQSEKCQSGFGLSAPSPKQSSDL